MGLCHAIDGTIHGSSTKNQTPVVVPFHETVLIVLRQTAKNKGLYLFQLD
jgi:hypothetical protein